jgi:ABC-type nitrate/sulfonate/bicarbonate transport system substrate-binding protein
MFYGPAGFDSASGGSVSFVGLRENDLAPDFAERGDGAMPQLLSRREVLMKGSSAALLGAASLRPALAAGATPVKIANASGALNQTMAALIRSQKFLESFGLDPDMMMVGDGTKILAAVISGSADASMASGFGQVFPAVEHGAKLKILGGGALVPTIALYTGKPYVNSLNDLEGRTVATGSVGALVYQLVVVLLRKYNVDVSKVRFVNIGSSADAFRAVSQGTVDAGPAAAALIPDAANYHVRPIPHGNMTTELPEYTYQGAWASDQTIAARRDVLVRTLAAYARLYRFVQTPAAREPFLAARRSMFPTAPEQDHVNEWNYIQQYKPFAVNLALTPDRLRIIQELNISSNVQKAVLPFEQVADMSLAADALKLLH